MIQSLPSWSAGAANTPSRDSYPFLEQFLPRAAFEIRAFEAQLWQWVGILVLVLLAWILSWVLVGALKAVLRPIARRTSTRHDDTLLVTCSRPMRWLAIAGLFSLGKFTLLLPEDVNHWLIVLEKLLVVLALAWAAVRVIDVLGSMVEERLQETDRAAALAVVPLGRRVVKVGLVAMALVAVLQNLGVQVTGLIAGLSIGGLAFAFAAQKTIENLFGGVSVVADQPVRVGDFCRFGNGQLGTVEEIGIRSTRVRTLERTLVTVPNSQFAEFQIENFGARDRIRLYTTLGLRYETSPDQLRHVLAGLRRLLFEHPRVYDEPVRVRFVGFGAHSLDLEVVAYIVTADWAEFLAIREDLYLAMMDVVAAGGTGFAFPSQTLYMGRDGGLDGERTREAEKVVQAWREDGELPFPDFTAETIEDLRGSGTYPPKGSVASSGDAAAEAD